MARIRALKPTIWSDEKLRDLAPIDRLVFVALISLADDAGRLIDSVKAIDGAVFSHTDDSCRESLERLASRSRIIRYQGRNGQDVIEIANWTKHQRISHPYPSALPDNDLHHSGMIPEYNGNHSRTVPEPFRPDVEVEVEDRKDVKTQIGREESAATAQAVTGPRLPNGEPQRRFTKAEIVERVKFLANGHTPATEAPVSAKRPDSEVPIIPRPPAVPEPTGLGEPAPNGDEPYRAQRRAAADWVKAHPAEYRVLVAKISAENPNSASSEGRKAFLSALLLAAVTRIILKHDPMPALDGAAIERNGATHRDSEAGEGSDSPSAKEGQAQRASNAPVVAR